MRLLIAPNAAQRPPPETPGRLQQSRTNYLNRPTAQRGGGSLQRSGSARSNRATMSSHSAMSPRYAVTLTRSDRGVTAHCPSRNGSGRTRRIRSLLFVSVRRSNGKSRASKYSKAINACWCRSQKGEGCACQERIATLWYWTATGRQSRMTAINASRPLINTVFVRTRFIQRLRRPNGKRRHAGPRVSSHTETASRRCLTRLVRRAHFSKCGSESNSVDSLALLPVCTVPLGHVGLAAMYRVGPNRSASVGVSVCVLRFSSAHWCFAS